MFDCGIFDQNCQRQRIRWQLRRRLGRFRWWLAGPAFRLHCATKNTPACISGIAWPPPMWTAAPAAAGSNRGTNGCAWRTACRRSSPRNSGRPCRTKWINASTATPSTRQNLSICFPGWYIAAGVAGPWRAKCTATTATARRWNIGTTAALPSTVSTMVEYTPTVSTLTA